MQMKSRYLAVTLITLIGIISITGCGDDPVSNNSPSMRAEIDGDEWVATSVTMQSTEGPDVDYLIFGTGSDDYSITLRLPADTPPGIDYDPGLDDYDISIFNLANSSVVYTLQSGGITITENSDQRITGSFDCVITPSNGTVSDQIRVLNGVFVVVK